MAWSLNRAARRRVTSSTSRATWSASSISSSASTTLTGSPTPRAERSALSWRCGLFWITRLAVARIGSVER